MTRTSSHRWPIDDVLARSDLAALLDEFAEPDQRAHRWHCPLADHADRHPSVTIHRDHHGHERWRCWSGDERHRGDAIDLVQAVRGCSRSDAIDELATRAGMFPDRDLPPVPSKRPVGPPPAVELDERVVAYAAVCARLLWSPLGAPVRDWLAARGLHDEVLRANQVGADPGRQRLQRARGLPYGAGPGATFPALDPSGRVRYVQTRALEPQPAHGKYDNPAAALAPNPRLTWAHPTGVVQPGQLVVCEGIPDALIAAQAGYRSVGLLGTNALDTSVAARIANVAVRDDLEVTVVVDVDDNGVGRHLGEQIAAALAEHDCPTQVLEPPDGHDLNTWALTNPEWHATLSRPTVEDPVNRLPALDSPSLPCDRTFG